MGRDVHTHGTDVAASSSFDDQSLFRNHFRNTYTKGRYFGRVISREMAAAPAARPAGEGGIPRLVSFVLIWSAIMLGREFLIPSTKEATTAPEVPTAAKAVPEAVPSKPAKVVSDDDDEFQEFAVGSSKATTPPKEQDLPTPRSLAVHSVLVKLCTS